jgi:hypothetical protein
MGYRRIPTIHTIDNIEGEEGLVVRMSSIRLGKLRRLMALTDEESGGENSITEILTLFQENLVSWNLENFEDGTPIPATMEGVETQEADFILNIVSAWMDRMTGTDGPNDLGKGSTDGGQFPGRPLTMEAL